MPTPAASTAKQPETETRMSFGEHLEELRWRLIKSVLALMAAFVAAMVYYQELLVIITRPHFHAMEMLKVPLHERPLLNLGYSTPIYAVLKLAFIVGVFAASPVIAWQIWAFVSAGLYKNEKKWVHLFAPLSFLLFVGGCAFGYFVLIPYGLFGMAEMMSIKDVTSSQYALGDYLSLVTTLTLVTGVVFELPLVMCFTTMIGLTTAGSWWRWTRIAIVVIVLAAGILTPSQDIYTQMLMAVPLMGLYFIGMGLSAFIRHKPRAA